MPTPKDSGHSCAAFLGPAHFLLTLLTICRVPHVALSEPFEALHIDLQSRLCLAQSMDTSAQQPEVLWESMSTMSVPLKHGGRWNGIAFWFEVSSSHYAWHLRLP